MTWLRAWPQASSILGTAIQSADDSFRLGDPESGSSYDAPFFADARYSDANTDPASVLGQATGSRMATDAELRACFEAWAKESDRVVLVDIVIAVVLFAS